MISGSQLKALTPETTGVGQPLRFLANHRLDTNQLASLAKTAARLAAAGADLNQAQTREARPESATKHPRGAESATTSGARGCRRRKLADAADHGCRCWMPDLAPPARPGRSGIHEIQQDAVGGIRSRSGGSAPGLRISHGR